MMKLFLDSNVVLDALIDRNTSHDAAKLLVALGRIGEFELWVSPTQWTDLFYILSEGGKRSRSEIVVARLKELRKSVRVCTMGETEIDKAISFNWADLEDAVVYTAAQTVKPQAIITNNKKDFALSEIPVHTVNELFDWLRDERGIRYAEIAFGK